MRQKINKLSLLLTFLLLNMLIVDCDSCKSEKEKANGEPKKEESVLLNKIKKQIRPAVWPATALQFERLRKAFTREQLEQIIEDNKKILQIIGKIEKGDYQGIPPKSILTFIMIIPMLQGISIEESYAKDLQARIKGALMLYDQRQYLFLMQNKAEKLMAEPEIEQILKDKNTTIKVREYLSTSIELLENLKKQAELKK